jgi:zinc-finger of transposase IS204/IS1001/IS1096/IS1165
MTLLCHFPGCRLLRVIGDGRDALVVAAEGERAQAHCPTYRTPSSAVHSRYQRRPADLPPSGKIVRLHLTVQRFYCHAADCSRRTFAERFPYLLGRHAHRTRRLA